LRALWVLLGLVCGVAEISASPLAWERQLAEVTASPGQKEAVAEIAFRNAGSTAINVTSMDTSCGCTTAHLERTSYGPGEKGTIRIVMALKAGFSGRREETINVMTDQPDGTPDILTIRVYVPAAERK